MAALNFRTRTDGGEHDVDDGEDAVGNGRDDTYKKRSGNWRKKEAKAATRPSPSERNASTSN